MKHSALARAILAVAGFAASTSAWSTDTSCTLQHPIVLSHMWGMGPICGDPTITGAYSCENMQNYERHCAQKSTLPDGSKKCLAWRVPDDEADIPPRDYNVFDRTLQRSVRDQQRYFSKEIVSKLRDTCGNKVYIADKPPYASHDVRARSLRRTVLQALQETGASKVNIIGVSLGVQDARYMTAVLPVDLNAPDGPRMNTKVASVVSLVGENGGADSAGIGLLAKVITDGGNWAKYPKEYQPALDVMLTASWKKAGQALSEPGMLIEYCQSPLECNLADSVDRYRWMLRSSVNLSPTFMQPSLMDALAAPILGWNSLRSFTGEPINQWSDLIPASLEANNGVHYMAYGAVLRKPHPAWPGKPLFDIISLMAGENDSNVSLKHQMFTNPAPNFENMKVMRGTAPTPGYHHTWFSGMNDVMYGPTKPDEQEAAPWRGSSADFYQQLARDMQARGL